MNDCEEKMYVFKYWEIRNFMKYHMFINIMHVCIKREIQKIRDQV